MRLVWSSSRIIKIVCNMVTPFTAKHPRLNGYVNDCKSIVLSSKTSLFSLTKVENYILILISSTSLPIITMKSTLLGPIPPMRMDHLNELTVLLVTMFVSSWLVLTSISSFGLMHFTVTVIVTVTSIFIMQWLWIARTPLIYSRRLERKIIFQDFVLLVVVFESILLPNALLSLSTTSSKESFLIFIPRTVQNILW